MKNRYIILLMALMATSMSYAQPTFVPVVDDTPIPGLVLAAIAAIGIGAYKLKNKK
jgi:hypothetical protein